MTHPRPHLVRARWQSLDGAWSFAFDPTDVGEHEGWYRPGRGWPLRIEVPFPWESPRSGVGRPAPESYVRGSTGWLASTGWYARRVDIPSAWTGERIWLVVGAAYWETTLWVDGRYVGEHDGGFDPFEFDITDHAEPGGQSEVVVRVHAPEDTDEYPHGKNTRHWYSRASGIWQSVFVEPRPATHVARLHLQPDPTTGDLRADVVVRSAREGSVSVRLDVSLRGTQVASGVARASCQPGTNRHAVSTNVRGPELWDCRSPTLYDVRVAVAGDDESADVVETTVGYRSISFEGLPDGGPRWLHLNGRPLYVRCVMSQGYHPDGIWAYPDEEVIRRDLAAAKSMGFDTVRLHVKLEDPRMLSWADRLGLLLWCEVPNFLTPTPPALERWTATWRAMLERDAGHPSVALWCMFIESWGLGLNQFGFGGTSRRFADDPGMQRWVAEMHALGRSLDPSRPIIENSVCEADHTVAEVNDVHLFPEGYGDLDVRAAQELEAWVAGAYPGSGQNFAPGYVQADQPLLVSSMAGWASVDGVETSFPLRALVNVVRSRERIAGYGWVQLYDVEWERTGLLTYARRPKAFGYEPGDVNADDVLVVEGPLARRARPGETVVVNVGLAHASGRISGPLMINGRLDGLDAGWAPVRRDLPPWDSRTDVDRRGVIALGRLLVPDPGGPFAGLLHVQARDSSGQVVAWTLLNVAWMADEPGEPSPLRWPIPLEDWTSLDAPSRSIEVRGSLQRIAGPRLACRVRVPEADVRTGAVRLLTEAALVDADQSGQSLEGGESWPAEIRVDGAVIAEVALPRLRSDSQGSLSIVNPAGLGSYGGRLDVPLGPLAELVGGEHILQIRPLQPGSDMKVVLFGPLLGRAPLGPTLVLDDGLGPRA